MSDFSPKIKTSFVRERDRYGEAELCRILGCDDVEDERFKNYIRRLSYLKAIIRPGSYDKDDLDPNNPDLEEDDGENEDTDQYIINYVGVIVLDARVVLWCYPKYLLRYRSKWTINPGNLTAEEKRKVKACLRQVLDVLKKYSRKHRKIERQSPEDISKTIYEKEETESPSLGVMLYLLDDYFENGLYVNTKDINEWNGSGEIIWDRTINDACAMLVDGKPYYMELQTRKRVTDDMDFFLRLHQSVMTTISREMNCMDADEPDTGLLDLFGYTPVELTETEIKEFGDIEYILDRISKELNIEFNTRKQNVLKAIALYLRGKHLQDDDHVTTFGTSTFYKIWEDICGEILNDQYKNHASLLSLGFTNMPEGAWYNQYADLEKVIEHPLWKGLPANKTLIPDIITISTDRVFYIFDTKYYLPVLDGVAHPQGQPGLESVSKQYLYQLAYNSLLKCNGIDVVKNCFIFPTEEPDVRNDGYVEFKMLHDIMLDNKQLENIQIIFLPAAMAYRCYLSQKPLRLPDDLKIK